MFLLKLSLRAWKKEPFSQVSSAIAVGFLLLLLGFLFCVQSGLKPLVFRLQQEQGVSVYLKETWEEKNQALFFEEVRDLVGNKVEMKWVDAPQFMALMRAQYPELAKEVEKLGGESSQVVPRYLYLHGVISNSVLERLKTKEDIESVEISKDRYQPFLGSILALRWIFHFVIFGIFFSLFMGLLHLSRINICYYQDSLSLLQFWGAGKKSLMIPGILTGFSIGFLGGGGAFFSWMSVGKIWIHQLQKYSFILKEIPISDSSFSLLLFLLGSSVGLLSGFLASYLMLQGERQWGEV